MTIAPATPSAAEIHYALEPDLSADEFIAVRETSGLAERRPVAERARIETMLRHADITITARAGGTIIGVSRALADFGFCCYLSDLAVDRACQGQGIGKRLIEETRIAAGGPATTTLLLSAPGAITFYQGIKMPQADNCFVYRRQK